MLAMNGRVGWRERGGGSEDTETGLTDPFLEEEAAQVAEQVLEQEQEQEPDNVSGLGPGPVLLRCR